MADGARGRGGHGRQDAIAQLVLRRGPLSPGDVRLLHGVFDELIEAHHERAWEWLRRRGLAPDEMEDIIQDSFVALYFFIRAEGFPTDLRAKLRAIVEGKVRNHVRAQRRDPVTVGLPSSGSERPASSKDMERALAVRLTARRLIQKLPPELRAVVDAVPLLGLTHEDAAEVLDLPLGTVKSRLLQARRLLLRLADEFSPSESEEASP